MDSISKEIEEKIRSLNVYKVLEPGDTRKFQVELSNGTNILIEVCRGDKNQVIKSIFSKGLTPIITLKQTLSVAKVKEGSLV